MPKIFEWNGFKFFFFSNEGMPREPRHVHVRKGEKTAKFWLDPAVSLENSYDMVSSELKELKFIIEEHVEMMRRKWDEYFPR